MVESQTSEGSGHWRNSRSNTTFIFSEGENMRRSYTLRFLFLTATCAVIIVGLHFYMYIYKRNSNQDRIKIRIEKYPSAALKSTEMSNSGHVVMNDLKGGEGIFPQEPWEIEHSSHRGKGTEQKPSRDPRANLQHKIVHLDLKGMPLLVTAYEGIFRYFKQLGITGVLMEYEDMFPYQGKLEQISNTQAYTPKDIEQILQLAKSNGLKIIPLIQTFGHLEFVLKLQEFERLREVPRFMQVICPTNNATQVVLKDMIDQVMARHPDIEYFHIGSDEVYHIGQCPLCIARMNKFRIHESQLFLHHVAEVAKYVKSKYNVQPLMWDDEFRKLDEPLIQKSGIGDLVEIVVWNYRPDVDTQLSLAMWDKYARIFKSVWIGSAFKGANQPNSVIVNETLYLANHFSWLKTMTDVERLLVTFKGIVLTGWQRFDHFSTLCELLPSSIPTLAACMSLFTLPVIPPMNVTVAAALNTKINCANYPDSESSCNFPGLPIFQEIQFLESFKVSFKKIKAQHVFLGWAQEINLKYRFSNPSHVEPIYQEISAIKMELDRSRVTLVKALAEFYPQWSVEEWMDANFQPFYDEIDHVYNGLIKILEAKTFPRRPLTNVGQDL